MLKSTLAWCFSGAILIAGFLAVFVAGSLLIAAVYCACRYVMLTL